MAIDNPIAILEQLADDIKALHEQVALLRKQRDDIMAERECVHIDVYNALNDELKKVQQQRGIVVTTKNSKYLITATGDTMNAFKIVKVDELRAAPIPFMIVGQFKLSQSIHIAVGEPATFDGWRTTNVLHIEQL